MKGHLHTHNHNTISYCEEFPDVMGHFNKCVLSSREALERIVAHLNQEKDDAAANRKVMAAFDFLENYYGEFPEDEPEGLIAEDVCFHISRLARKATGKTAGLAINRVLDITLKMHFEEGAAATTPMISAANIVKNTMRLAETLPPSAHTQRINARLTGFIESAQIDGRMTPEEADSALEQLGILTSSETRSAPAP